MSLTETLILLSVLFIIISIVKSAFFKGMIGEAIVFFLLKNSLNKNQYIILKDITLKKDNDTTQIDFIIFSVYGIFVIEVKHYKGWIFGNENQKFWTQSIYRKKNQFQNPLHQNYKHIKFIQNILNLNDKEEILKNIVVFVGDNQFKTKLPNNVCTLKTLITYLKSFDKKIIPVDKIIDYLSKIESAKLQKGRKTNKLHKNNLHNKKIN